MACDCVTGVEAGERVGPGLGGTLLWAVLKVV